MSLECVVFVAQRQKLTANGLNKPKQKISDNFGNSQRKRLWKKVFLKSKQNP